MTKSYEVWSSGATNSFMAGMNYHPEVNYDTWYPGGTFYRTSECESRLDERGFLKGKKRMVFLEELIDKTQEDRLVFIDPLKLARRDELLAYNKEMVRRARDAGASFISRFPDCGSTEFRGSVVVYGDGVRKGLRAALNLYENNCLAYHSFVFQIFLKRTKSMLELCAHQNMHFDSRERQYAVRFAQIYKFYTGTVLKVEEMSYTD